MKVRQNNFVDSSSAIILICLVVMSLIANVFFKQETPTTGRTEIRFPAYETENEAVKAALESQLVQLKENFTQQGLKVESVEVNVSAQGFERSLDQQEQQGQNQFQNANGRNRSRRIRLNGIDGAEDVLPEDMAEDDRIVADMMIRNGNSVDITV